MNGQNAGVSTVRPALAALVCVAARTGRTANVGAVAAILSSSLGSAAGTASAAVTARVTATRVAANPRYAGSAAMAMAAAGEMGHSFAKLA